MFLGGLLSFSRVPAFRRLMAELPGPGDWRSLSLPAAAKTWLLSAARRDSGRAMLVVTAHNRQASQTADELSTWLGSDVPVACFPEPDALFYETITSDTRTREARLRVMQLLATESASAPVIVASVRALMQHLTDPATFGRALYTVRGGERLELSEVLRNLVGLGYRHELLVEEPGAFARRGGIVDVFPLTLESPVRLDFLDDQLESIRLFDPITQRSGQELASLTVGPALEAWPLDLQLVARQLRSVGLSALRGDVQEQWSREVAHLEAGDISGYDLLWPYFVHGTLLGYLPDETLIVFDEAGQIKAAAEEVATQAEQLRAEMLARGEMVDDFPVPYSPWSSLMDEARKLGALELSWRAEPETVDGNESRGYISERESLGEHFAVSQPYGGRLKVALDDAVEAIRDGTAVVIVSQQSSRLAELCRESDVFPVVAGDLAEAPEPGSLSIVQGSLQEGFSWRKDSDGKTSLLILTDREIFGWSKVNRVVRRRSASRATFVTDLIAGDFVVHVEHGVARYVGLVKLDAEGGPREYLSLEYADGDKLFVPSEHADRVNRYVGIGDHVPNLNRLGGAEWARTKSRVKAAAKEVAKDLLDIHAARELKQGHAFGPDAAWQQELEASFPYVETPDQAQAIAEVKNDMERPKPMDRLLCGDVGYGKTEIALRAAFKAVTDGRQVAILVPTTVLAQQHFNTFRERMQAFPVRVEMLSRFRSEKEQREVLASLLAGTTDICIGTHRLLQKDVAFKDLGLVVIDEEQRFGVVHKERLKQLRKEVDVLTLTATPIPRTLHMALVGLRDISTMETPPEERLPIKTYVTEYDEGLVREAIIREMERGGQVYFVHNRVQSIYHVARRVAELVPEASLAIGHGQLPEDQLEQVMLDFAAGKFDVLVCSTIIESGLDIPNVNTIIVDRSDRLGLAQMYQLRGRVGRGANRAYAYFMFPKDQRLNPTAEKRLRTIFEATELGAGFRIAMKDLEIRGAGNLLGAEQHGHVAAVGFDLYCRLLAEAVQELQGKVEPGKPDVRLDLPLSAYLPADSFDDAIRLNLYQRLAATTSQGELSAVALEMLDRFGRLPRPVVNLLYFIKVKLLATSAGVNEVGADGSEIALRLTDPGRIDRGALQRRFPSLKLGHAVYRFERGRGESWMDTLEQVLDYLGGVSTLAAAG